MPGSERGRRTSWYVYILRCRDGTLYTGITVDVRRRVTAHRSGVGARYTRARLPVRLVYQEPQPDRSRALRREHALRRLGRAGKLALIRASHLHAVTGRKPASRY